MVTFKKYENAGSEELANLGSVKTVAGKGGKIALLRKNYKDLTKRVAVVITNAKGQSAVVPCSKQVSEALRSKSLTIAQLVGLDIVETTAEDGSLRQFISMPATGGLHEIALDKIAVEAVEAVTVENPEELAW
jgi:hypothetical protein